MKLSLSKTCSNRLLAIAFQFEPLPTGNFSSTFTVKGYGKHASIFYPVYSKSQFQGIRIATKDRDCISNISVVQSNRDINLWPFLWLPEHWKYSPLYQGVGENTYFNFNSHSLAPTLVSDINFGEVQLEKAIVTPLSSILYTTKNSITIGGYVARKFKYGYLGSLPPKNISLSDVRNKIFYAEGYVKSGGISIGLINQQSGAWETIMNHPGTGKFKMYFTVNKPGIYVPHIANCVSGDTWNSVKITKLGWMTNDFSS